MLSKLVTLALVLIAFKNCQSQISFNNDTAYSPYFEKQINRIDSAFHLSKEHEFEFRFWVQPAKSGVGKQLFILALKNNQWSARLFERVYITSDTIIELPVKQDGLQNLWEQLESKNVLTIKSRFELKDKNGNAPIVNIFDGMLFRFELITNAAKRNYVYHCPKAYKREFGYIKEYKMVVKIIRLICNYCGIKYNWC